MNMAVMRRLLRQPLLWTVMICTAMLVGFAPSAHAEDFADSAFQARWAATDAAVKNGQVSRSYFWGPEPFAHTAEPYVSSPSAARHIQYFDKARMEINDATANKTSPFYVSNGLLTVELVSGRMQMGDSTFTTRQAAQIPVAGDSSGNDAAPTYASFRAVTTTNNNNGAPNATGTTPIIDAVDRNGIIGTRNPPLARVSYAHYEAATKHNIASVFWDYLRRPPLGENAWLSVFGYPISEPYWAKNGVTVAGKPSQVLIQLFERRVLTYEPGAPAAYQVQMGNIGQHYFRWRYGTTEPVQGKTRLLLIEASGDGYDLVLADSTGGNRQVLTAAGPHMDTPNGYAVSNNGNWFAYTARKNDGTIGLYSVTPTNTPQAYAVPEGGSVGRFALAPVGSGIAVADVVEGGTQRVMGLSNPEDTNVLTPNLFTTSNKIDDVLWSADAQFVFIKEVLPDGTIAKWLVSNYGYQSAVRLPNFGSTFGTLVWSPVAPIFAVDTNLGIRTYNAFTRALDTVTSAPRVGFTLARPFYSADGTHIIYAEIPNPGTVGAARINVTNLLTGDTTIVGDYNSTNALTYGFSADPARVWVSFRPFGVNTTLLTVEADITGTGQETVSALLGLSDDDHVDATALARDPVQVAALIAGDVYVAHRDGSNRSNFAAPNARRIAFVTDTR